MDHEKKLLCLSDEVVFRNAQNLQCDWFQINIHQFWDGVTVNCRKRPRRRRVLLNIQREVIKCEGGIYFG